MKTSRMLACCCALLTAAVLLSAVDSARGGFGDLKDILKKGKDAMEKPKKDAEKKTPDAGGKAAGGKNMVFSKTPIKDGKAENPTTSFKAGDRIYGLITLPDSIKAVTEAQGNDMFVEIKCHKEGKYDNTGSFNIKLVAEAMDAKQLVLDIAPDADKMTAYKDKNIRYQKKFERDGKRGGPMQLTKYLSNLKGGKHTIKLVLYRYKDVAVGTFTIEGDDFAKPYGELFKQLEGADTAGVKMPEAKMTDAKLEADMVKALKNSQVKEAREGEILKVVIIDPDWFIERHKISGRVLFRYIRAYCAVQEKDGPCWMWKFVFKQDFIGDKFQPVKLHGIHERKKIPRANVK